MAVVERCWRCSAEMKWIHGTWQCPRCRFKLGCCEGEPQAGLSEAEAAASCRTYRQQPNA